jgi:hypothetical protein
MEKIETRTAVISRYRENILWQDFKPNVEIDVADIKENISACIQLVNGRKHSAVLDVRGKDVSITQKAMKYGASKEVTKYRIATAHLTSSISDRLIGNFFIKFFRPKINNKMFSNEKQAIEWLKKIPS